VIRRLVSVLCALLIGTTAALAVASPALALDVTAKTTTSWAGGYSADITVKNDLTVGITGWQVNIRFHDSSSIMIIWNAQVADYTMGTYKIVNKAYNGSLAPGASTTFGVTVLGHGAMEIEWLP
jgi:hypothetical protein